MSSSRHAGAPHLHVPGNTPVHRLAPEAKLVGLLAYVVVVAVTPRQYVLAFAVDALVLGTVVAVARLSPRIVLARLSVIVPFIAFALFIPFIGTGERVDVGWFSLSVDGLWATWNIIIKATLGATASTVLAATTTIPDILHGLTRLHLPRVLVGIVAFMFRYLDLLVDQLRRMRSAMVARCHDPRWIWQVRPIASSVGVLFVRSYERGERVHQAMLARGYRGTMPELEASHATARQWCAAVIPALIAAAALATSLFVAS